MLHTPSRAKTFRVAAKKLSPVPEGKVRCPLCSRITTPTKAGKYRAHGSQRLGYCAANLFIGAV